MFQRSAPAGSGETSSEDDACGVFIVDREQVGRGVAGDGRDSLKYGEELRDEFLVLTAQFSIDAEVFVVMVRANSRSACRHERDLGSDVGRWCCSAFLLLRR